MRFALLLSRYIKSLRTKTSTDSRILRKSGVMHESASPGFQGFDLVKPPLNRSMLHLDRSRFTVQVHLLAAIIPDPKQIHNIRTQLSKEVFKLARLQSVTSLRDDSGTMRKALMLQPHIKKDDASTWSPTLAELLRTSEVSLMKHDLCLGYDYWTYDEILDSILPEAEARDPPRGFNLVGHVAHLNLRESSMPYKYLIAEVIKDKNPSVRTVINKTDNVGANNPYRTFNYEVLTGPRDMNVVVHEQDCTFHFDYSKVYWNSKLQGEHVRLVETFQPGEAIADIMAGVGPFAVPAAKKRCFVWANDLNPESVNSLRDAIQRNKVTDFARSFNLDGASFIKKAAKKLLLSEHCADVTPKQRRNEKVRRPLQMMNQPKTFSHFIMNLPASALEFLPSFRGIYAGKETEFTPHTSSQLPLIHVYCFNLIVDGVDTALKEISERISHHIGHEIRVGSHKNENEATIVDVRDVAPLKHMFCATFRLPAKVAFADP